MLKSKYILFAVFLLATVGVSAQKAERDYIRKETACLMIVYLLTQR